MSEPLDQTFIRLAKYVRFGPWKRNFTVTNADGAPRNKKVPPHSSVTSVLVPRPALLHLVRSHLIP
jgi:hypothetical protein